MSNPSRTGQWLAAILLSGLFTAFQIQSSLRGGSLSLPVTYDDVGYFNDVLPRLNVLFTDGGLALLKGFWTRPLHAPLQELLALAGFGLMGPHAWAADAMNSVPLALMLRLFLYYATPALGIVIAVLTAAALLGLPLLGLMILEFRPDMLCALLTASGALVITADPDWRAGARRSMAIATALFAGALLAKPTLAPVTAFVFIIAAGSAVLLHSKSLHEGKRIGRVALVCGGIGALIVLPYYLSHASSLIAYIWGNAFGSQAAIWRKDLSWRDHALYYLTGPGGAAAIGRSWIVVWCAMLVIAVPIMFRARRTSLAVLLVAVAAYCSVTVPGMKSPFIGLIVPAFVLATLAVLATSILGALQLRVALPVSLMLLVFSATEWRPASMSLSGSTTPAVLSRQLSKIYMQAADVVASLPDLSERRLYFPVIAPYLNPDNLLFELMRRGSPLPAVEYVYFDGSLAGQKSAMDRSNLIILFSDDSPLPLSWPQSAAIHKEINAAVEQSGQFVVIATLQEAGIPGRITILKRK